MILIDQSAGSRELVKCAPLSDPSLACLADLSFSANTKSSADVCFSGNGPKGKVQIGIEFKHIGDFLSSIQSGRLQATQLQAMTEEYDVCWLLLCGEYRCGEDGFLEVPNEYSFIIKEIEKDILSRKEKKRWFWYVKGVSYQGPYDTKEEAVREYLNNSRKWKRYEFIGNKPIPFGYLESALHSLSRAGIQHKHFTRIEDCAQWIGCTYRSWQKEWHKHHLFRTFDKSADLRSPALMPGMDSALEQKMRFAKEFPAMGFERAMAAARHFDSPRDMFNADVDEWMKIPGIGKVVAKEAVRVSNQKRGSREEKVQSKPKTNNQTTDDDVDLELFS